MNTTKMEQRKINQIQENSKNTHGPTINTYRSTIGAPEGGGGGVGAMCYVQNSLSCYVLCKFLFTLLCEIKIWYYAEV